MTEDRGTPQSRSYAFGPFVLIPERQLLLEADAPVRIGSRALDILTALVEQAGELVGKRELMTRVWPETAVDESNLKVHVAALRRVLGDGGRNDTHYIATVTGRGYQFIAPVKASSRVASDPTPIPALRHNLPTGATHLVGRADALAAIQRDFETSRIVTLVGPGGIGKTTVALAIAELGLTAFPDGVWLVEWALVKDPQLAPHAIAAAMGLVSEAPNVLTAVLDSIRSRKLLLILDNCEHLIDAAAACASRMLAEAAGVKLLVTSREPLMVSGERVRKLSGLEVPPRSPLLTAEQALRFPAVQLFVDRATDRLETFKLTDGDASTVAELCRRLDGVALAIELAAARVDVFGPSGLLTQLDDRFNLLVGRRAGPERQRTLLATLDWSYGLLPPNETALLRAVSVFAGLFDIEGAAAVAGVGAGEAASMLAELAAKSLLSVDLDGPFVAYRLLETTGAYCADKLRASGEEGEVHRRHSEHLLAVLERAQAEWGAIYGRVIDDLRAALAREVKAAEPPALRIRLTLAGLLLWNHFSLTEECRLRVSQAVALLHGTSLAGTAIEMKLKLWLGGSTMLTRGFDPQAMGALKRALEIAVALEDSDHRLRCLMTIGIYELFAGEHAAGLEILREFATVAMSVDPSVLPEGESHVAIAELFMGQLGSSRLRLERLARRDLRYFGSYVVRYLSDPLVLVESVLAQVQWLMGAVTTAERTATAAIERAHERGHHLSLNNALSYACATYYWSGNYEECSRYVERLEENVNRHGLVARRPVASFYRAALAHALATDGAGVATHLQRAIEEFRSINHLARMPYYLSVLAAAQARQGELEQAEQTIRSARNLALEKQEAWCLPEVLRVYASIVDRRGRPAEAAALLCEAIGLAQQTSALSWRLRAANDLAKLWQGTSRGGEARQMLLEICGEFTEGFETRDLQVAAQWLASLEP